MSYMRDGDRRTRGVGAIAASDNVSRARRARQSIVHQTTRQRDHAMSAIAQGALGRVPIGPGGVVRISEPIDTTYNPPPRAVAPPHVAPQPVYLPPPSSSPPPSVPPPIAVILPPIMPPPPVALPPPGKIPPSQVPPQVIVTGPGSGSGVVLGPGSSVPILVPQAPEIPDAPADEEDHTARNLAIAGGVALAAYLIFRRPS